MKIFFMYLAIFFLPFFMVVSVVDELIYIDGKRFFEFLNTARMENKIKIDDAIKNEDGEKYWFYIGKDVACCDVLEHLKDE